MGKKINNIKLSDSLDLTECTDGFWIYDKKLGRNIAMRADTERAAFVEALTYYQGRCKRLEAKHQALKTSVEDFLGSLDPDDFPEVGPEEAGPFD